MDISGSRQQRHARPTRAGLLQEGDSNEHCYFLLEGTLAREVSFEKGGRQIVALYVPGDVCGLSTLADDRSSGSIVALSPVSYLPICRNWLLSCVRKSPELLKTVWREMAREAAISAVWTANIGQRPAYRRLAHFFCELEARWRAAGHDAGSFEWGTQVDLGAATGLSVVHVNKTLRRLEADGLVSWGRRVQVHDVTRLCMIADFDPAYLALDRESLGRVLSRPDAFEAAQRLGKPLQDSILAEPAIAREQISV